MIYRLMTSLGQMTHDDVSKLDTQKVGKNLKGSVGTIASSKMSEYRRENPEKYAAELERQRLRRNAIRTDSLNGDSASEMLENERARGKLKYRRKTTVEFYDKRISLGEDITAELIKRELTTPKTIVVKKPKDMLSFDEFVDYARKRNSHSDVCALLVDYDKDSSDEGDGGDTTNVDIEPEAEPVKIPENIIIVETDEDAKIHKTPGFYVYMISYPTEDKVKIGKHTGNLHSLRTRYNTTTKDDYTIHAFTCGDNALVEKSIHYLLRSKYHCRLEFFKDTPQTREIFRTVAKLVTL